MGKSSAPLFRLSLLVLLLLLPAARAWSWNAGATILTDFPVDTYNGKSCAGTRATTDLNCTANEFTVSTVFSAADSTPRMCVQGSTFEFLVDLELSGSNTSRYDPVFYAGQTGNAPNLNDASKLCSVAAVPQPFHAPWTDLDTVNTCADYPGNADSVVRFNKIMVLCQGDTSGFLTVPYLLAYVPKAQKSSDIPRCAYDNEATYPIPTSAKCVSGTSSVSGSVSVFSAGFVDVEKITVPAGETESFTFSASGTLNGTPSGQVMALTNFTVPSPRTNTPTGGTSNPAYPTPLSSSINNISLSHGQTARFYINALDTAQLLSITEAAPAAAWEPTATIACSNLTGTPIDTTTPNQNPNPDGSTRKITANISTANSAAYCTVTNYKRPKVLIQKNSTNDTGTFGFTMTNLATSSDSITTESAGTSKAGIDNNYVDSRTTAVTITETVPSGWPTNPVSASCVDNNYLKSGNPAPPTTFGSLSGNILTIPTTNLLPGAEIVCTFTNTRPTVKIRKTSNNGTGTFSFAGTNGVPASFAITTDSAGTPKEGSVYTVSSVATDVTVTETPAAGWPVTPVAATTPCSDTNGAVSGNGATPFGSLSGNQLTIPAANLKPAAQIICDFVNTKPTVQISKNATNGSGTFGFTMTNLDNIGDSITTTLAGTPVSGVTSIVTSTAATVTISETTVPTGWPANPVAASCSDSNGAVSGNGAATFGSLAGNVLTIPVANLKPAAQIVCTVTNTFVGIPLLSVIKFASTDKALPGQTITYTIQISNTGTGNGTEVLLNDELSAYTAFGVTAYPSTGTPFDFFNSGSGLTFGTPEYYIPASGWSTTTPADLGGGFNDNITKWRIPMTGSIVPGGGFTLNYRTRVK